MKNFKNPYAFFSFILGLFIWGCSVDDIQPSLEELRNEAYDLVVVSDNSTYVPVAFKASGTDMESVTVEIVPQGAADVVATASLKKITANNLNRVSLNVPFPGNDVAPSGRYTVNYKMVSKAGQTTGGAYDINVINNVSPVLCEYTRNLPAGKSVWVRLYVPEGASLPDNDNNIYLTGSFGSREGGSDWDGGGASSPFKFTRLTPTCYELAINLQNGDQFKITRGAWSKEMAGATGSIPGNMVYNGESEIKVTAFNWSDRPTVTPNAPQAEILNVPPAAVKPGMLTVVATLGSSLDANSGDYYVIEKGATNVNNGFRMTAFEGANKVAAAVPKKTGVEYVVVKGNAQATGKNRYGFLQSATWDGNTNPVHVTVGTFGAAEFTLGNKIVIVGGATPGDWNVGAGQDFTKTADGKYAITIALNADSEYLLLPDYGAWGDKWAYGSGNAQAGTFDRQGNGGNLSTQGLTAGTYKIEVDFTKGNGSYKLTKQ